MERQTLSDRQTATRRPSASVILLLNLCAMAYPTQLLAGQFSNLCAGFQSQAHFANLNAPHRVPDEYLVTFKEPKMLSCIAKKKLGQLQPLPGVLPSSTANAERLALALARSIGAEIVQMSLDTPPQFFVIRDVRQAQILKLGNDPRIALIEGVLLTEKD